MIDGGTGDDVFMTSKSSDTFQESTGSGQDTVKSTVSYRLGDNIEDLVLLTKAKASGTGNEIANQLTGNVGNNVLKGLAGADTLDGGKGNDVLIGGSDDDTFGFASHYGKDEIRDFHAGEGDTIYVHNWKGIDNFGDVKSHAADHGKNVWITFGGDTLHVNAAHIAGAIQQDIPQRPRLRGQI